MSSELLNKSCKPCKGGVLPLTETEFRNLVSELIGWEVVEEKALQKQFRFKNFAEALSFVNRVGEVAEIEGHHPDIFISWNKVTLKLWTHKVGGLTENDFILAAKVDAFGEIPLPPMPQV